MKSSSLNKQTLLFNDEVTKSLRSFMGDFQKINNKYVDSSVAGEAIIKMVKTYNSLNVVRKIMAINIDSIEKIRSELFKIFISYDKQGAAIKCKDCDVEDCLTCDYIKDRDGNCDA